MIVVPDPILPALVGAHLRLLREALLSLKASIDNQEPFADVMGKVTRARQCADDVDQVVGLEGVSIANSATARHLGWAARLVGEERYPDQDAADLLRNDL